MGIGSHISERRLVDDLTRMGLNESIVRVVLSMFHIYAFFIIYSFVCSIHLIFGAYPIDLFGSKPVEV